MSGPKDSFPAEPQSADVLGRAIPSFPEDVRAEVLADAVEQHLPADLPPDVRESVTESVTEVFAQQLVVTGPLPPSHELAAYETIVPGGAERLLRMAEKGHEHNMAAERSAQAAMQSDRRVGLWMGYSLMVLLVVGAIVATILDRPWAAAAFLGATAVSVLARFVQLGYKGGLPNRADEPGSSGER